MTNQCDCLALSLRGVLASVILILVGCTAAKPRFSDTGPIVAFRPLVSQEGFGGALRMKCVDEKRESREAKAFFGLFFEDCRDPGGSKSVHVTEFDYLRGESPAQLSGILLGDRVIFFNGCQITSSADLSKRMSNFTAGNTAEFGVKRGASTVYTRVMTLDDNKRSRKTRGHCENVGLTRY